MPHLDLSEIPEKRTPPPPRPEDLALLKDAILFENDEMIAINKPAGWAVQGGTNTSLHLDHLWRAAFDQGLFSLSEPPRIVHRLDKNTTGVLVFAKTREAAQRLGAAFKEGAVKKVYHAITVEIPSPESGTISQPLKKREGKQGEKMEIDPEGKEAITDYKVLKTNDRGFARIELRPQTGRTHQLRAHCAFLGAPILGDGKYGSFRAHPLEKRTPLMLHASALTLPMGSGKTKTLRAPFPGEMKNVIKELNL